MKRNGQNLCWILAAIFFGLIVVMSFYLGYYYHAHTQAIPMSTGATPNSEPLKPLLAYTLPALKAKVAPPHTIHLEKVLSHHQQAVSVLFFFEAEGKKISGLANFPLSDTVTGAILMLRGWAPQKNYQSGTGSKNAALVFAQNQMLTFAPDFLGYGESDEPPADVLQARFEKPWQIKQLISDLHSGEINCSDSIMQESSSPILTNICTQKKLPQRLPLGMWAHSNGGQIALSTLEIADIPIPTTLWAPVSVGFPYNILFFTDEEADEGKASRRFIANFEKDYDSDLFSHSQNLALLPDGLPLQIHHGSGDEAALIAWSDELMEKLKNLNQEKTPPQQWQLTYYRYPGANHNLQPNWQQVIERDLAFFRQHLLQNSN